MKIRYNLGAGVFIEKDISINNMLAGTFKMRPDIDWLKEYILFKIKRE